MYSTWKELLIDEMKKPYWPKLMDYIKYEYEHYIVYPKEDEIMQALLLLPLDKVKVVILGQDPYHEPGQAMGLSFSVHRGEAIPKSLQNIYKELHDDLGCSVPKHGDLTKWEEQGVLLLNSILTVRAHNALSHQGIGWENFTDAVIKTLNEQNRKIVFILWGSFAASKRMYLNNPNHLVLVSPHPSPLSAYRGFFGSRPFSKTNAFLDEPIDWQIK